MKYRRIYSQGGTYFFTVVTAGRKPILASKQAVHLLRDAMRHVMASRPFKVEAMVVLPDHLHCIWRLPYDDADFSTRWRLIKTAFTKACISTSPPGLLNNTSNRHHSPVWQNRFWEHLIRNEDDFTRHVEYIHYNPVNHGLVNSVVDWPYSSFHRYVRAGQYSADWGNGSMNFEGLGYE